MSDLSIQQTAGDASLSKLSCVKLGYYQDEFAAFFVPKPKRNPPIINRGYFSRVIAVSKLREQFLAAGGPDVPKQILCLGAGMDTSYFSLKKKGIRVQNYFEVDFPDIVAQKSAIIKRHPELSSLIDEPQFSETGDVAARGYHLLGADLRNLPALQAKLLLAGIDFSVPTFFVSECVLIYMSPAHGDAVIRWAGETFDRAAFVTYEQIEPHDRFGQTMVRNLLARGISLASLEAFPSLQSQINRYISCGWDSAKSHNMLEVSNKIISRDEQRRISAIEILDELEEWSMIQEHYCLTFATRDKSASEFWKGWDLFEE